MLQCLGGLKQLRLLPTLHNYLSIKPLLPIANHQQCPPTAAAVNLQIYRSAYSFLNRSTGEKIWKGLQSVSNAGRRRGRGRGANRKVLKDLNKGQIMGTGEKKFIWPGLNAPITKGNEISNIKELGDDPKYRENIIKLREQIEAEKRKRAFMHPLERGWSGNRPQGKWIGSPDPVDGEVFVGFDTKLLVVKPIGYMKPNFGRSRKFVCISVTGNGNNLVGYGIGKSGDMRAAIKLSRNKAGKRLLMVNLEEYGNGKKSILYDFYSRFGSTKVSASKKPPGHGITAHRCISGICSVLGITDIHCTVEGSKRNYLHVTRAFLLGLINQKSFQQLADEKKLNVVEYHPSMGNYPVVRASPAKCRTNSQIGENEILDFGMYIRDGRVIEPRVVKPMYYTKEKGWRNYMKKWNYRKTREQVRIDLIAKYGQLDSYLTIREKQRVQQEREQFRANQPAAEE